MFKRPISQMIYYANCVDILAGLTNIFLIYLTAGNYENTHTQTPRETGSLSQTIVYLFIYLFIFLLR